MTNPLVESRSTPAIGSVFFRSLSVVGLVATAQVAAACSADAFSSGPSEYSEPAVSPEPETSTDTDPDRFIDADADNLITFSADVDTASYTHARSSIRAGALPAAEAVRTEEFLNYFRYSDEGPAAAADEPFAIHTEVAPSPFGDDRTHMMRVAIRGMEIPDDQRQPANLVFLVDTSGSMALADKLGLVKRSLRVLLDALGEDDTIALVTYAGTSSVVLEPTPVANRGAILDAIEVLTSGGSTNGAGGITEAYRLANEHRLDGGVNRVILCTDGDFNVGMTGEPLIQLVEDFAADDIFLTALGFGQSFNDQFLEDLTNRGNGNYAFIDNRGEAIRALSENVISTLQVIAKDVKIQIDVDADVVESYRLIGYHNRRLQDDQFRDDTVDAGEIGSGHIVVALVEMTLKDAFFDGDTGVNLLAATIASPFATVNVAYKKPEGDTSAYTEKVVRLEDIHGPSADASADFNLSAAVAEFGEHLAQSTQATHDLNQVRELVESVIASNGASEERSELAELIGMARALE